MSFCSSASQTNVLSVSHSSGFQKMPEVIVLKALSLLDRKSLAHFSSTSRCFSSHNKVFWDHFCSLYRGEMPNCSSVNYCFHAILGSIWIPKSPSTCCILDPASSSDEEETVQGNIPKRMITEQDLRGNPYDLVHMVKTGCLVFRPESILADVIKYSAPVKSEVIEEKEVDSKLAADEGRSLSIRRKKNFIGQVEVDARICTLFTFFLNKKALITKNLLENLIKRKGGGWLLMKLGKLLEERRLCFPDIFILQILPLCNTYEVRDACFQLLPDSKKNLDLAIQMKISLQALTSLVMAKCPQSEATLTNALYRFSVRKAHYTEKELLTLFTMLIEGGGHLNYFPPKTIFLNPYALSLLQLLIKDGIGTPETFWHSFYCQDFLGEAIRMMSDRPDCSAMIYYLVGHGAHITFKVVLASIKSDHSNGSSSLIRSKDVIFLLNRWYKLSRERRAKPGKILRLIFETAQTNRDKEFINSVIKEAISLLTDKLFLNKKEIARSIVSLCYQHIEQNALYRPLSLLKEAGLPINDDLINAAKNNEDISDFIFF